MTVAKTFTMDLNADVGEGSQYDHLTFELVTSVNVAAGGHAGGGLLLEDTVSAAAAAHLAIGAHPAYPDRRRFGLVSMCDEMTSDALSASIVSQILEVARTCDRHGRFLHHVKPHGALYNDSAVRADVADLLVEAHLTVSEILGFGHHLPLGGPPFSLLAAAANKANIPYICDGFADRAYQDDHKLLPRTHPSAVLRYLDQVTSQAIQLAVSGTATTITGHIVKIPAESFYLHGDTTGDIDMIRTVREALTIKGVTVEATRGHIGAGI